MLLRLKLGQRLDGFWTVAGPKCVLGEFIWIICILFTHDRVLSFTYQKRTPFYSPPIFLSITDGNGAEKNTIQSKFVDVNDMLIYLIAYLIAQETKVSRNMGMPIVTS